MKNITLWLFALFTCWQISAQTGTVVVGVNNGTPNTATGNPSPLQDYYKTQRIQILYTASELTGAGLVAGNITSLGWVATNLNLSTLQENYTISMKSTTSTVLTTTFEAGASIVYGPTDFTPTTTGNVMFPLTTPFAWNGTSNILIEICAGLSTGVYTENVSCANSTTTDNKTVYVISDSATAPCTTTTGTTTNQRPLLVVTGNVASCLAPLNLVSGSVTSSGAAISWDPVTPTPGVGYEYVVSTSNVAPTGAGTATTATFAVVSSLLPQTTYFVFVRSVCATGTTSGWNGPISFTTACAPITSFPVLEPFTTFLPNACWIKGDDGDLAAGPATFGTNGWKDDGFGNVGATGSIAYNHYTTGANDWIISPQYTIPATGYELKFDAALTQWNGVGVPTTPWDAGDVLEVLISTNGFTNWTVLYTIDNSNPPAPTGAPIVVGLNAYASQTVRIAYRIVSGATDAGDDTDIFVDNFQIRLSPTCPDQTGLVVGGITSSGANASWDALTGVTGYQYAVTTSATPPATGTATTNTFAVISTLAPQTTYYLHVRATCSGSTFGNWTTVQFITNCANVTSYVQNFDAVTTPAFPTCWAKVGTGGFAYTQNTSASSTPNTVYMVSYSATSQAVVSTQQVSNLGAGTNRIKFNMRANFTVGDVIEFGYLTDPTSDATFVPLTSFTATSLTYSSYQYSPPAGTYSDFPAFRHKGNLGNSILIDDVVWEANPSCPDQTGVVFGSVTSSGVGISWDAITGAAGYEYAVITSATPPASGTATTATFASITSLAPQTLYYIHVRPMCSAGVYGAWKTVSFTTACVPVSVLPWNEGFEGLTTVGATNFPSCWFKENGDWSSQNTTSTYSNAHAGTVYIRDSWSATNEYIWTPGFNLTAGTSYDFSSFVQGDNGTSWVVDYFVNSSQVSTGATQLGASYTIPGTGGTYTAQPYAQITRSFVPATTGTYYFAVRVNEPTGGPWYASFDDFELKLSPSCIAPLPASSAVTAATATLSWPAVTSASVGYEYVLNTTAADPTGSGTATTALTYSPSGLTASTVYYFHIRSACAAGSFSAWTTISFTTSCAAVNVPYTQDFEGATVPALPLCTSQQNVGTGNLWAVANNPGYGFTTKALRYTYNSGAAANVWFYTNGVNLVGGTNYKIAYDYGSTGTAFPEKLKVAYGTSASSTAMTTVLMDHTNVVNDTPLNNIVNFTPATSGVYYFGFNANSIADQFYLFVDNINVDVALATDSFSNKSFSVYPNPVKDILNINYNENITKIQVINLLGQEVITKSVNNTQNQIDMSGLVQGTYLIKVTANDVVKTIKVIKQ